MHFLELAKSLTKVSSEKKRCGKTARASKLLDIQLDGENYKIDSMESFPQRFLSAKRLMRTRVQISISKWEREPSEHTNQVETLAVVDSQDELDVLDVQSS